MALCAASAWAYNFSAVAPSGQTLYYNIADGHAEVVWPGTGDNYNNYVTGDLIIPSSVTYNGTNYDVTAIASHIGSNGGTFYNCSGLTSVIIPSSVTSIGNFAFWGCSGLTSVTIPSSVTSIGDLAFYNCSGMATTIYTGTVAQWCNITFGDNNANPLYYSHSLTIDGAEITNLVIPEGVTSISSYAFYGCSRLTSVTIPSSVTSIGGSAFSFCSGLTSVTISEGVTSIDGSAFSYCSSLTSVTIPSSVTSICGSAFAGCSRLTEITGLSSIAPSLGSNAFYGINTTIPINIPCGSSVSYTSRWNYFSNFVEALGFTISAQSADTTKGSVEVLTAPTCQVPQAVVNAIARSGSVFDHWSDGSTDNPRTMTLTSDTSIYAVFTDLYTVTVTGAYGGGTYAHGSTATLMALPQVDGVFAGWSDGETANPRTVMVVSDTSIVALFRAPDTIRVYDTTTVYDTVVNIVYDTIVNIIYDTTEFHHIIYDTTRVFDTVVLVNVDTLNHYFYDTTVTTHYIFDSTWVFDSVYVFDTVYIHDTIYITSEGIGDVEAISAKIYQRDGQIVVEGANGNTVVFYDVNGRMLATKRDEYAPLRFDAPVSGTYMIKIGNHPARKMVVVR